MKKISSALLAVVLLFCFLACTAFAVELRWADLPPKSDHLEC